MNPSNSLNRRLVLSGAPGSPTQHILMALQQAQYPCFPSSVQQLIEEQSKLPQAILPRTDLRRFAHLAMGQMWKTVERARTIERTVFMEASIQDLIAYLQFAQHPVEPIFPETLAKCAYGSPVFLLPPHRDTFVKDLAFEYTFAEAKRFFTHLAQSYENAGFRIVLIPSTPVDLQVRHIAQEAMV